MSIKFIDLNPIVTPVNDDILVLNDVSEGTTKHIRFEDLRNSVIDQFVFADNAADFVTALNGYNDGTGSNGLNTDTLDGQEGSYYLDYNNFENTPDVATNLSELVNNTGFIRYDTTTNPAQLVYENNAGASTTKIVIRSDNVAEGVENLYYTDARVGVFLDNNFAGYYNQYTSVFDEASPQNSLFDNDGTFIDLDVQASFIQSNIIEFANTASIVNYSVGQDVRLYGASEIDTAEKSTIASSISVTTSGFALTGNLVNFSYRIAEFSYENGTIGEASAPTTVSIGIPTSLVGVVDTVQEAFNLDNFVQLSFSNVPANNGLLLYRSVAGGNYKLFAVLGPREIDQGTYIDYFTFDYVSWSGKNIEDNTYFDTVVHFPTTPPGGGQQGWVDRTVTAVDAVNGRITLSDFVKINADAAVEVAHNDTARLQSAINSNAAIGRRSVELNAKTYVTSELFIPSNFAINGAAYITKLVKLPWSGYGGGVPSARIINSLDDSVAFNISLVGLDIDGNNTNQYLFSEGADTGKNYGIDLGLGSTSTLIDKVRLTNVIGGGIHMPESTDFKIVSSEFAHSGVTDRYDFSPLLASGSENIIIANNKFENFTDYLDTSITNKGIVSNNIINNCGSGLLTYGSRYYISSPNVLIGPAGEFLPSTDVLNSRFDSVNIIVEANTQFTSDVYVYQENGVAFNLAQDPRNQLIYELYKLSKNDSGQESLYEAITAITLNDIPAGVDRTKGEFKFAITSNDVDEILTTYSVDTLVQTNPDHVGLVYRVQLEEHVKAGDLDTEIASTTYTANTAANTSSYTVNVDNADYLFIGATVELLEHGIQSNTGISSTATISNIIGTGSSIQITADFDGIIDGVGSGGFINIINDFTLVQGRVL